MTVETVEWRKTACILCENNCGIQVQLGGEGNRHLSKIRGDKDHIGTRGYTCNKALRLDHYQNGGTRITSPLRREADGSFTEISWDTAFAEVAAKLNAVKQSHGGESILFYGGGGQGNHLGGAYRGPFQKLLGSRYSSNALAQEKCGEGWVDAHLVGNHTVGDFEHAEVSVFVGKNPYQSHGVARARTVLKAIAADPTRSMIVIDPVRSETADLADFHLQVRPGTDAWCLAAMDAVLVEEDLIDHEFARRHLTGLESLLEELRRVDIAAYAETCGVDEDLIRRAARRIGTAASVSTYEDLGVQQAPNTVLVSYLQKMLWVLTGNFAKPGGMAAHSWMAPLGKPGTDLRRTPVTGVPMPLGFVPCNVIPDEILSDHPNRFRAMVVESANPAHSLADSQRFADAFAALDLLVVVDIAMTETARLADYVLPAASQFEKWEATFFTLEFPHNHFHLRAPLMDPLPGTKAEPEIWARLVEELLRIQGQTPRWKLRLLTAAARVGRKAYFAAFAAIGVTDRSTMGLAPYLLYRTLGPTLPDGATAAAALWGLSLRVAREHGASMRRAGHRDHDALFDAILAGRSGVVFTEDEPHHAWEHARRPVVNGHVQMQIDIPDLLAALAALPDTPSTHTSDDFPIVLMAGQRRTFSANTIFRDPSWRLREPVGTLRISPSDGERLGLTTGDTAKITTSRGSATATVEIDDRFRDGHAALPNGFGLDLTQNDGTLLRDGVALNELTDGTLRDPIASNPWHKYQPARIEALPA